METLESVRDDLLEASRGALQSIRKALIELYDSVGADPSAPQEVARRFGLNRNLTWKISRVLMSKDPFSSLNHLPGQQGLDLAVQAFCKAGAPRKTADNVQLAVRRLHEVIDVHADDRDQFELTLESMGLIEREARMESGRELAFRGNSMIWGVQTRTRLMTTFIAPSPSNPGTLDWASASGLMGFRRLRPNARWRLARFQLHDDSGASLSNVNVESVESDLGTASGPFLFREFCSPNMPTIETVQGREGVELVLPGGPIGNLAAFDCVLGIVVRGLPRYRTEHDQLGSVAAAISLPTETLVFDLLYHHSVTIENPEVLVFGFPHGGLDSPAEQSVHNQLPVAPEPIELAGQPPAIATPLVSRYNALASRVYERMGWNPQEFRGLRVQIAHPPMSSRVVIRWRLPSPD